MVQPGSITTFVVDTPLPWPDDCAAQREGAYERGAVIDGAGRHPCAIRKIAPGGATVEAAVGAAPGSEVALELGHGQRRQGRVEWARSGQLGIAFAEPLDIVALINRNLVAQPAERRAMPRVELRRPLHVKWCEHLEPAVTRNISSSGIQVEGPRLPPVGTLASLFVDGLNLPPAEVVWRQGQLAGFELFEEVRWSSLIAWVREAGGGAAR
jgi:hypothetical protein